MPSSGQILRGYVVVYGCGRTLAPAGVAVTVAVRHFWIYAGLLAGVADGCGVQLHPALSISVVSKSVSRVPSLVAPGRNGHPLTPPFPVGYLGFRKSIAIFCDQRSVVRRYRGPASAAAKATQRYIAPESR